MLRLIWLFFCVWIILPNTPVHAQNDSFHEKLSKKFKNYDIATIPSLDLYNQIDVHSRNNNLVIDLGNGMKWDLELEINPIFSKKYTKVFGLQREGNPIEENRVKPMKGKLKNVENSEVAISFNKHFIYGEIRVGNTAYFIEPLSYHIKNEKPDQFVIYSINDIIQDDQYKCGHDYYKEAMERYKPKETVGQTRMPGGCFIVEYAIAADWSMVVKFGSDVDVENHITGVVNNVQTNWDTEFDDELQFEIVTFWISSCSSCDPWSNSTDPEVVLISFTNWANSGAFGVTHDVGSMWSNRVYISGIVGLAWVSVVCTGNRYNVLRDFTSNANQLRVMNSHELGHNFSAVSSSTGHDPVNSGFIMAPSVNTSTTWSSQSRTDIQGHYLSRWCLSNCSSLPPPVADFDFDVISDCVVGQVQYNDQSTGATSWSWTFPGGTPATSTQQNPLVSYLNPGTFGATLVATNSSGSDSHTISNVVTIGVTPMASFTYTVNGSTVTFTNTSTNATSYSWDFGDGNLSSLTNPVHTYMDDGFYNVVLTAYNDCGPNEFSEVIEIATPPIAEFSANPTTGCTPLAVNFIDESSLNTIQWVWSFEGGIPNQSFVQNPVVIYNQPGLYSVTLTAINTQGSSTFVRQQYIEAIPNPTSSFTYVKNGLTATFTNTSINATDYLWNFGDGFTSTLQNPVHTYANPGTYTVTLQSSNDCATTSSSQMITFSLAPIAGFTTSNSPEGCATYTVQFLNTSQNSPTSYFWTFEGGSPVTSVQEHPVVIYQNTGSFDVTLVATNALGSDTIEMQDFIIIETVPSVTFTYQHEGLNYNFTSLTQNANSLSWDFGDGTQSTLSNPTHTYPAEGTYTVTLTAFNECGENSSIQQITVVIAPMAAFSANVTSGCVPLTVQFTDQSSPNTTQWMWSFPGGNPSTSNQQNPVVVYNNPGSYNVTLIASNTAGQDTFAENNYISTRTLPTTGFTMTVDGPTVTITNTGSGASQTEWQIQENGLQTLQGNTVMHTFSSNGSFSIRQINSNDCGTVTLEQFVTINAYPVANFVGNANGNCAPVTIQFTNTSVNSTSFSWVFENGNPATSNEQNPVVTFASAGTHMISLTASNQYGNSTSTQSITVLTVPNPDFSYQNNALSVSFTNLTQGTGNSYLWNFGDGTTSNESNPMHTYPAPGTYQATLTATNECGSFTITQEVVIDNRTPVVAFDADIQVGCVPLEVHFMDQSTNDPTSWAWTFEGGTPSSSSEKNPVVVYNQEGIYDVTLVASNGFGSSAYEEQSYITVYGPPTAAFTYNLNNGFLSTQYNGSLASSYSWNFGDGSRSNQMSPDHLYTTSGDYTIELIVENPCGTDTIQIGVQVIISSVNNTIISSQIKIAPNPNQGEFKIFYEQLDGQNIFVEIMNMQGVVIQKWSDRISGNVHGRDVNHLNLPSGIYVLKFVNESGAVLLKKLQISK